MEIDQDEGTVNYLPHFGDNGQNDNDDEEDEDEGEGNNDEEDEEDEEEDEDEEMHALPVIDHINPNHPFAIPGLGRGRGRGRGRGGIPFSGAGHSLSSSGPASATNDQNLDQPEMTTGERDQQRRQRVLEAMANRAKVQEAEKLAPGLTVSAKRVKEREIPSLQSLCCYQVAGAFVGHATLSSIPLCLTVT